MRMKFGCKFIAALISFFLSGQPASAGSDSDTAADVLRVAIPAAGYAMTFCNKDPEGRGQFWKSLLTTTAVTYGLKAAVDDEGPNGHGHAFPSGHTSIAFSGAAFIQRRYGWQWGVPAYAAASFVGWSRVDSDDHDLADVAAGAAIGLASSFFFTTPFEDGAGLVPVVGKDSLAVMILGRW